MNDVLHCYLMLLAITLMMMMMVGTRVLAASVPEEKDGERTPTPFLIVHADPTANRALTAVLQQTPGVWAYAEMQRWRPAHAQAMWDFTPCARTQGRWPMCGSDAVEEPRDPFDESSRVEHRRRIKAKLAEKHRHHRRDRVEDLSLGAPPRGVGFGLDMNVVDYHFSEVMEALLKQPHPPQVFVLQSPGSISRTTLRNAAYTTGNPHSKETPGREVGVARSLYDWQEPRLNTSSTPHASRRLRHLLYHNAPLVCSEGKTSALIRLFHKHRKEQARLETVAQALEQDHNNQLIVVHRIDIDKELLADPWQVVLRMHNAMTRSESPAAPNALEENSELPQVARDTIMRSLALPMDMLDGDCVDILNSARLRFAIWESDESTAMIADIDQLLSDVEQWRRRRPKEEKEEKEEKEKRKHGGKATLDEKEKKM
jgi:hypothetical protein